MLSSDPPFQLQQLNAPPLPHLTHNIQFKPTPTTSAKCSKLKLSLYLDSTVFVAGGTLNGLIELECLSNKIRLGRIAVVLSGFEGIFKVTLESRPEASSQPFLKSEILIQGERKPPSPAVFGPQNNGYWQALKQKNLFAFSFKLPADCPSSFQFQSLACLKYTVTATIDFEYKVKRDVMFKTADAVVLETRNRKPEKPLKVEMNSRVFLGGNEPITLAAMLSKQEFTANDNLYVGIKVKNGSRRSIQGLKILLESRLLRLKDETLEISREIVKECYFKQQAFTFMQGEERSLLINVLIPSNLKTVANTNLAQVHCYLVVQLDLGYFTKPVQLQVPIEIFHPATFDPPPQLQTVQNMQNKTPQLPPTVELDSFISLEKQKLPQNRVLPWSEEHKQNQYVPQTIRQNSVILDKKSKLDISNADLTIKDTQLVNILDELENSINFDSQLDHSILAELDKPLPQTQKVSPRILELIRIYERK